MASETWRVYGTFVVKLLDRLRSVLSNANYCTMSMFALGNLTQMIDKKCVLNALKLLFVNWLWSFLECTDKEEFLSCCTCTEKYLRHLRCYS